MRGLFPISKQGLVSNNKRSMVLINKNQINGIIPLNMKQISLLLLFAFCGLLSRAQLTSNFHLSLGIQSKYMWRGIELGYTFSWCTTHQRLLTKMQEYTRLSTLLKSYSSCIQHMVER